MVQRGVKRRGFGVLGGLMLWAALGVLPLAVAAGAAGDLDTTFGSGGSVAVTIEQDVVLLGVQSDGKAVLGTQATSSDGTTMHWRVFRQNSDGTPDASFGTGGEVLLFGQIGGGRLLNGLVDSSDRILCTGRAVVEITTTSGKGRKQRTTTSRLNAFTVVRLLADGALDTGFGTNGAAHTALPGADGGSGQAWSVALQPDGKIVAAGQAFSVTATSGGNKKGKGGTRTESHAIALVRYHPDGSVDTSFGVDGVTVHDATLQDDKPQQGSIGIQSSGGIVLGSYVQVSGGEAWVITRYGADGSIDTGFGRISTPNHHLYELLVDGSDRIVAAGSRLDGAGEQEMVLARYLPDGALDSAFGTGGYATTSFGDDAGCTAAAVQSDGKIIVICFVGWAAFANVEVTPARFSSGGTIDLAFGLGGHGEPLAASGLNVYPPSEVKLDPNGDPVIAKLIIDPLDGSSYEGYVARWCAN